LLVFAGERYELVEATLQRMSAQAHRTGSARGLIAVHGVRGFLKLRIGALPEADAALRVELRVMQEGDFAAGLPFAAALLAEVAIEAGDLAEAEAMLDLLPPDGWTPGVSWVLVPAARGRLRLAQGRAAEALADFQTCQHMFGAETWGVEIRDIGYMHARSGAAAALMRLGRTEQARQLADAELADARLLGAPRSLGVSARIAGLTHGGPTGLALLRESVDHLEASPALLERAHSLAALGGALRRAGERSEARDCLTRALDLADRCGAGRLTGQVHTELNAAGARPRRTRSTGVEALTPTELRVVRLAADGHTNREIAQELYVTVKTVEGHLARAFAKLGIERRSGLRKALDGENTRVATLS
jgi:DNA-binding CsgD family transcriptional regulator